VTIQFDHFLMNSYCIFISAHLRYLVFINILYYPRLAQTRALFWHKRWYYTRIDKYQ